MQHQFNMGSPVLTWKLSNARAGMLSSNSLIMSHGPSPTPTKTIDRGYSLKFNTIWKILSNERIRKRGNILTKNNNMSELTLLELLPQLSSVLVG